MKPEFVALWCQIVGRWVGAGSFLEYQSSGEPVLPDPSEGFSPGLVLIQETAPRKLKKLRNAVPRLCAHNKEGLGDVLSVPSGRILWPNKFRKSIPRFLAELQCALGYERL